MAADVEEIRDLVAAAVAPLGLELFDVELQGSGRARTLRVAVTRAGGVDLEAITAATEALDPVLDDAPIPGPYTLEVSSPGLERSLRRPEHWRGAVGETVSVKVRSGGDAGEAGAPARVRGVVAGFDGTTVTLAVDGETVEVALDAITSARTVFEWGTQAAKGGTTR